MRRTVLALFTSLIIVGCFDQAHQPPAFDSTKVQLDSPPKTYVDTIRALEEQSTKFNYDTLGMLISKVRFDVNTNNKEDYTNGVIPFIRVDSPQVDIPNLIGKDDVVVPSARLVIIFDYPLSSKCSFELASEQGFTRAMLVREISKHYYQVYDEEERTATIKTVPLKQRKIFNRNQTNGKYGIWGHDIGDLVLDEIHVYKNETGKVTLTLQLES